MQYFTFLAPTVRELSTWKLN